MSSSVIVPLHHEVAPSQESGPVRKLLELAGPELGGEEQEGNEGTRGHLESLHLPGTWYLR